LADGSTPPAAPSTRKRGSAALYPAQQRQAEAIRRHRRRRRLGVWGVGLIVLLALGAVGWFAFGLGRPSLGIGQPTEGGIGVHVPDGTPLTHRNRPPSSGPHSLARAPYGVSSTALAPANWLHVLEHGGVTLLFKCANEDECGQRAAEIRTQVYEPARVGAFGDRKITATPYQDMDAPFTIVAWDRILPLQTLDAAQILTFYDLYVDRGPERAA
jgi:hypothetical protein